MDMTSILKGAFTGFILCITILLPVFYLAGNFLGVSRARFRRVFLMAAVLSFISVYAVFRYKVHDLAMSRADAFVGAYAGGWLAGLVFGVTQLKSTLIKFLMPE